MISSPARKPAFAAGPPGATDRTTFSTRKATPSDSKASKPPGEKLCPYAVAGGLGRAQHRERQWLGDVLREDRLEMMPQDFACLFIAAITTPRCQTALAAKLRGSVAASKPR